MRRLIALAVSTMVWAAGAAAAQDRAELRLGGGVNYWVALEDIDLDEIEEDGFSYVLSLQLRNPMAGLGVDAEMMPERYGDDAYSGLAYVILGRGIYAAAGIGINYVDGEFAEEPFYALRAGVDLEILSSLRLDIYATYRFQDTADLKGDDTDIDTDTVFLGAALRLAF